MKFTTGMYSHMKNILKTAQINNHFPNSNTFFSLRTKCLSYIKSVHFLCYFFQTKNGSTEKQNFHLAELVAVCLVLFVFALRFMAAGNKSCKFSCVSITKLCFVVSS